MHFSTNGQLGIGDISGEVSLNAALVRNTDKWPFQLTVDFKLLNPSLSLQSQVIDSINVWQNEFEKSSYLDINLSGRVAGFDISLGEVQVGNGVFLNSEAAPIQLTNSVTSLSAMVSRSIDFWIFKSRHSLIYNQINDDIILAPELQLAGRLSTGTFFSKYNARIALGVDYYLLPSYTCLLYTSPSPRDATLSRMPSSA